MKITSSLDFLIPVDLELAQTWRLEWGLPFPHQRLASLKSHDLPQFPDLLETCQAILVRDRKLLSPKYFLLKVGDYVST